MPPVTITQIFYAADRSAWREWLRESHNRAKEIWLLWYVDGTGKPSVPYLHAVEEAICFGWIDGMVKRFDSERNAARYTPRRANSHWTELNKERARRLIANGLMTEAGFAVLPDLSLDAFSIAPDILEALQADPQIWANFQAFPPLYQRIRVSSIEEARRQPEVLKERLDKFLHKTRQNKMFGNWE